VSLFGMAVSASELPAMSRERGSESEVAAAIRGRIANGLTRIGFFVVPSSVAFLALGDVVGGTLYQSGRFTASATQWLWGILAGSAIGLIATTQGRLYASSLYALRDTRTPLRFAVIRVVLTVVLGIAFAFPLPKLLGIDPKWGVVGLTASAGMAGWVEFLLLRRAVSARIGTTAMPAARMPLLWMSAIIAAAAGWGVKLTLGARGPLLMGAAVLPTYCVVYLAATWALRIPQARAIAGRLRPRGRRGS
jgi:putative peptidoglycan lipid II flippase